MAAPTAASVSASGLVLLGVCDDNPVKETVRSYIDCSKIGGNPVWIFAPGVRVSCKLCEGETRLIAQIYCPLADSPYHRVLYIFSCVSSSCFNKTGSIVAIRSQILEQKQPIEDEGTTLTAPATQWCEGANAWSDEEEDVVNNQIKDTFAADVAGVLASRNVCKKKSPQLVQTSNDAISKNKMDSLVQSQMENLSLREPNQAEAAELGQHLFQEHYINVFAEPEDSSDSLLLDHEKELMLDYEGRERVSLLQQMERPASATHRGGGEFYEKSMAKHGDAMFERFMKRISRCPEQCLRYCWNGMPIFILDPDQAQEKLVGSCQYCGSPRVFELQLMPQLINALQTPQGASIEFGTAIVFSCKFSCWSEEDGNDKYKEELVVVQPDPDGHLFKSV